MSEPQPEIPKMITAEEFLNLLQAECAGIEFKTPPDETIDKLGHDQAVSHNREARSALDEALKRIDASIGSYPGFLQSGEIEKAIATGLVSNTLEFNPTMKAVLNIYFSRIQDERRRASTSPE